MSPFNADGSTIARAYYFADRKVTRVVIAGPLIGGSREFIDIAEDDGRGTASCVAALAERGADFNHIVVLDGREATWGEAVETDTLSVAETLDHVLSLESAS